MAALGIWCVALSGQYYRGGRLIAGIPHAPSFVANTTSLLDLIPRALKSLLTSAGFIHFFRPKLQGLFEDFPGPYFEISWTFLYTNLPTAKQNVCVESYVLGINVHMQKH